MRRPLLGELGFLAIATLLAVAAGGGAWWMSRPTTVAPQQIAAARPALAAAPTSRPIASIVDAARALKLVTYTFNSTIETSVRSDKWYGDALASVRAPVRYQYGVDLDTLRGENAFFDAASGRYVFVVEPPRRISAEVDVAKMESSLDTSGIRWRAANADQVERARKLLGERAKTVQLRDADEKAMTDASREQLEKLLRDVIAQTNAPAAVAVRFGR